MQEPPSRRADFFRRLGFYVVGLAIGVMLLGLFQQQRAAEHARRQAREAASSEPGVSDSSRSPDGAGSPTTQVPSERPTTEPQ